MMTNEEYTSVHEAAHLVMAHSMNVDLWGATISKDGSGTAWHDPCCTDAQQVMIALAGAIATEMAGMELDESGCESDFEKVKAKLAGGNVCGTGGEYADAVFRTLDKLWPAVRALAKALREREAIPGDEAKAIIEQALGKRYAYYI